MRAFILYFTACFSFLLVTGCDDGDIYPKEPPETGGIKASMNTCFKGTEAWPDAYQLVLAGFGDEDATVPLISKVIPRPDSEKDSVSVTLNGLQNDVTSISISIISKGRKLIHHYYTYDISGVSEDIVLPVKDIDVAHYGRIQEQVFDNYCSTCHGAGNYAAAGLHLTKEESYNALVEHHSALQPAKFLVKPNYPDESFLLDILQKDIINYNHTDVLPEAELITLISTWIKNGCKNESSDHKQ